MMMYRLVADMASCWSSFRHDGRATREYYFIVIQQRFDEVMISTAASPFGFSLGRYDYLSYTLQCLHGRRASGRIPGSGASRDGSGALMR